jgi:GntR family transcriptional regulator
MKYNSHKPIYLQIAYKIVLDIYNNTIPLATLLPSVRELSKQYEVTPKTIQTVTKYLAEHLIIFKKPSVGSVITNNINDVNKLHLKHGKDNTIEYINQMRSLFYKDEDIKSIINEILGGQKHD